VDTPSNLSIHAMPKDSALVMRNSLGMWHSTAGALGTSFLGRKDSRKIHKLICTASLLIAITTPQLEFRIYCSNCSTFYQQMFGYTEAVNTALTTAKQLYTQIQQYKDMITQGVQLPNSIFESVTHDLGKVASRHHTRNSPPTTPQLLS
jgi:hypothetical protein